MAMCEEGILLGKNLHQREREKTKESAEIQTSTQIKEDVDTQWEESRLLQ